MNCKQANEIEIINYLNKLGIQPTKYNNKEAWYLSPLREEKTPSFKVNLLKNIWYDFGEGTGGSLVDFIVKLNQCSVKEVLNNLTNDDYTFSFPKQKSNSKIIQENKYKLLGASSIKNINLIQYLVDRKLQLEIAKEYCLEVEYSFDDNKKHYAIGFMNDDGGMEIRSKNFKSCFGKKEITTIKNSSQIVSIFESWSDFLSYLGMKPKIPDEDFIILNSTSLVKKTIENLMNYSKVKLYFDNDNAGDIATNFLLNQVKNEIIDCRTLYRNHNDLNDYLTQRRNIK